MNTLLPTSWPRLSLLSQALAPEFAPAARGAAGFSPALDVWSDAEGLTLEVELPGLAIEDIELSVHEGVLSLSGERKAETAENATEHRRERLHGRFERRLRLPFEVDATAVQATLSRGVLRVRLPKAEAARPRRIEVTELD